MQMSLTLITYSPSAPQVAGRIEVLLRMKPVHLWKVDLRYLQMSLQASDLSWISSPPTLYTTVKSGWSEGVGKESLETSTPDGP